MSRKENEDIVSIKGNMNNKKELQGEPFIILHAEDDEDHAKLVGLSFKEHRVANKMYWVKDGEEALNYLYHRKQYSDPEKSPEPDIVLLDLRMPKVDGLEVLKEIKTSDKLKGIPVVIFSSSSAEKDIVQSYEYHANSYIVKPLDFDKFTSLMNDLGFYWLGWNRLPWKK